MPLKIKTDLIIPVILAGGTGSRMWPLSRELYPKQFLSLSDSGLSMLQDTVMRLQNIQCSDMTVVCNEEHRFLVAEQLRNVDVKFPTILLEPFGRNTAPAIGLAALSILNQDDDCVNNDSVMLVLPADHIIGNVQAFESAVAAALPLAKQGNLVTFGIIPNKPETGYGYINRGQPVNAAAYQVTQFVEKPNSELAYKYVESGEYYWNSGMFMFTVKTYLDALEKSNSNIFDSCQRTIKTLQRDKDFIRIDADVFSLCPNESIDYAVMEKSTNVVVVPMEANWSDLGSWSSLWEISSKDGSGNVINGQAIANDSKNNYLFSESALLAVLGVENLCIVQTKDAVLVAHKDKVQDIKQVVEVLKLQNKKLTEVHCQAYRPWGHYESVDEGIGYQVKRITVKPGEKLSTQMHHHRAEHWIVVTGTALVTIDGQENLLCANQSIYVPLGAVHRLENPGKIPLELIEVQSGSYLGEDDIVRFDDIYGRV